MAAKTQGVVWKKRILLPFWVFRIICNLFIIALSAIALKVLKDSDRVNQEDKAPALGVFIVFMLLIIACLLIDVICILLFLRDALKPLTLLIFGVIQTIFWAVVLVLDIIAIAEGGRGVGIIFILAILASYAALLIYAAVQYHRQRKDVKRGSYSPAANPASVPLNSTYNYGVPPQNTNTAYTGPTPYQAPPQHGAAASYFQDNPKTQV